MNLRKTISTKLIGISGCFILFSTAPEINIFQFCQSYKQSQTVSIHDKTSNSVKLSSDSFQYTKLELPYIKPEDLIAVHTGFTLSFNRKHMQANWVAYELTRDKTVSVTNRTDNFRPDPKIATGTATNADYQRSGYDRGHLAPAADMGWSKISMSESFYFSNICPQEPGFNRGIWSQLEQLMRTWAVEYGNIFLATGPVLSDSLPYIGANKVSIPDYFYKVILDTSGGTYKGIGFVLPNKSSKEPLQKFAVSIDSVESLTGINFFVSLPDSIEYIVESTLCIECWAWQIKNTNIGTSKTSGSVQCKGITKAGNRCSNQTREPSGYCQHHKGQAE
jgi:endonuclease G, mitochondrial